jgi:AcrR family transcriptional regulator
VSSTSSLTPEALGSEAQRDRRQRILDTAMTLATRGGFDAVQMRAVADGAGVALGTLYRYFPSKVHLLVSALAAELTRINVKLEHTEIPGATGADRVVDVLTRTTRSLQREPHLTEALTRAFVFADAGVGPDIDQVAVQVQRLLLRAMRDGVATRDPEPPSEEEAAIVNVIGDVWFASLTRSQLAVRSTSTSTATRLGTCRSTSSRPKSPRSSPPDIRCTTRVPISRTCSGAERISAVPVSVTPRSSKYSSPSSTRQVIRRSRSRFLIFCELP